MNKSKHIENVIQRKSKDEEYGIAIVCFLEMLKSLDIEYAVMGSTALQTYLPFFHRLPNDLDITLSEEKIGRIEAYCSTKEDLSFQPDFVASRVFFKKGFSLHLIPEQMKWVDRSTNIIFERYQVLHRDRLEYRPIIFVNYGLDWMIPVHCIEYSYCLYVTQRLDCNIYHDCNIILKNFELDTDLILEFCERVPVLKPIFRHRFSEHRELILRMNPELLPKIDILHNLAQSF